MDFSRFVLWLFLILLSSHSVASTQSENLGIALVHGTSDHRQNADGGYWKREFIDLMASGLSKQDNLFVVSCDFRQYMWHDDAAGCTVDQLLSFINAKNITKLVVYTHSDGANVLRWILSNPTYDKRYQTLGKKISQVVALAPSSAGTPLADEVIDGGLLAESIAWLIGYRSDAVKQQRISDMAIYNEELLFGSEGRPALSTPFRAVVGTDVTASPLSSASYCNGYTLNAALKLLQMYLSECSDGFLECSSQTAAGTLWFYDTQKTLDNTPLSHSQSRHNCFGLEEILLNDLAKQGVI